MCTELLVSLLNNQKLFFSYPRNKRHDRHDCRFRPRPSPPHNTPRRQRHRPPSVLCRIECVEGKPVVVLEIAVTKSSVPILHTLRYNPASSRRVRSRYVMSCHVIHIRGSQLESTHGPTHLTTSKLVKLHPTLPSQHPTLEVSLKVLCRTSICDHTSSHQRLASCLTTKRRNGIVGS